MLERVSVLLLYLVGWCLRRFLCVVSSSPSRMSFELFSWKIYDPKLFKRFAIMNIKSFTSYAHGPPAVSVITREGFSVGKKLSTQFKKTSRVETVFVESLTQLEWRSSFAHPVIAHFGLHLLPSKRHVFGAVFSVHFVESFLNYVCRARLPLITHMFCITCFACSLPSPANRTEHKKTKKKR